MEDQLLDPYGLIENCKPLAKGIDEHNVSVLNILVGLCGGSVGCCSSGKLFHLFDINSSRPNNRLLTEMINSTCLF